MNVEHIAWIPITSLGLFGVLLFFVHTSLVLMHSMERGGLAGWRLFRNFYVRRAFRIYPLSILAVVIALALHLDSDVNGAAGLSYGSFPGKLSAASHLLLVQNLTQVKSIVNVLWSLPFEVQMYIFLPFLFVWIRGKRMFWPLLGVWAASLVTASLQPHAALLSRASILVFVPNFLAGVIAFSLPRTPRLKSYAWPIFIFALITLFTVRPVRPMGWALCLVLGLSIPRFCELQTAWLRLISNRIATYSYGIYLSHQFCIWIAFGLLTPWSLWLRIPLFAVMLVALPIALYHAIEKPMIQLGIRQSSTGEVAHAKIATPPVLTLRETEQY